MKVTYAGSANGKSAVYSWEGNKAVGKGEISITGATPPGKIELDLHMINRSLTKYSKFGLFFHSNISEQNDYLGN